MPPYSKRGWTDHWDIDVEEDDEEQSYRLELEVVPATQEAVITGAIGCPTYGPPHSFIALVSIARYEQVDDKNTHDSWQPRNSIVIHRSEHGSIAAGVVAVREAAKRAELLRKGPSDE
jgi:hypothetical protein